MWQYLHNRDKVPNAPSLPDCGAQKRFSYLFTPLKLSQFDQLPSPRRFLILVLWSAFFYQTLCQTNSHFWMMLDSEGLAELVLVSVSF